MSCSRCHGADALTHDTFEHSEDWVNLADARQTGEVIWMDTFTLDQALAAAIPENSRTEVRTRAHVDRRIIQALVDTIIDNDPYGDQSVGIFENPDAVWALTQLQKYLQDNPESELDNG
jgi:hypothetical protein